MFLFNTVLGDLFRGFLLPRMNSVFGRGDWVANGLLFASYCLRTVGDPRHAPRDVHHRVPDEEVFGAPGSGIAVHSAQSVFLAILLLTLVI